MAEAKSLDEAKNILDKSEAIRIYARQMKNKDMEIDAAEIRIRAERKWGQLYKEHQSIGMTALRGKPVNVLSNDIYEKPLTLDELGVSRNQSSRAQKVADIPDDTFEGMMGEWRERVN